MKPHNPIGDMKREMVETKLTYCENCDNVEADSRKRSSWQWLCLQHPRLSGFGYLTKTHWDQDPPLLYCRSVNAGACPLFTPRRDNNEHQRSISVKISEGE